MAVFKSEYSEYFKNQSKDENDFLSYYDQVDIVDFTYNSTLEIFIYPCPCGDSFTIGLDDLKNGETIARCNSCSLLVNVIYTEKDLQKYN
jgi:diphthamide biosynthesis protein 3